MNRLHDQCRGLAGAIDSASFVCSILHQDVYRDGVRMSHKQPRLQRKIPGGPVRQHTGEDRPRVLIRGYNIGAGAEGEQAHQGDN